MPSTTKVIEESHPDWNVFQNKAEQSVIFSNFAYKQQDDKMQAMVDQIPEGYELFLMTDHVEDVDKASFRCVAFMNQNTKDIVFATAGTRAGLDKKGAADLLDDALMVAQNNPRKMMPAQTLNEMVLDSLGEQAKEYNFHYTGHSLGAAMAEMQAADMDIKLRERGVKLEGKDGQKQLTAVTFENPGSKPMIEKMYEKAGLSQDCIAELNFCEFNNRKNIINDLNKQTGRTYTIVPHSQKERNPTPSQMVFEVAAKIAGTQVHRLLGKAFGLLGIGGITDSLEADHKLSNFNEVFIQKAGAVKNKDGDIISLEEAYSGIKPIQYDKDIAKELQNLKQDKGDVGKQNLSMTAIDSLAGEMIRVVFSNEELQKTMRSIVSMVAPQSAKNMIDSIVKEGVKEKSPNADAKRDDASKLELPSAQDVVTKGQHR